MDNVNRFAGVAVSAGYIIIIRCDYIIVIIIIIPFTHYFV